MNKYIVWEFIKHEGWESHQFDSLVKAEEFKNRMEIFTFNDNEYILTLNLDY